MRLLHALISCLCLLHSLHAASPAADITPFDGEPDLETLLALPSRGSVATYTAMVSFYARENTVHRMLEALFGQTHPPTAVWVSVYGSPAQASIVAAVRAFQQTTGHNVSLFQGDISLGYHGRFQTVLHVDTDYVFVFDDDCIPGRRFVANALHIAETGMFNGAFGIKGHLAHPFPEQSTLQYHGPLSNTSTLQEVDIVGGGWLVKADTVKLMFRHKPHTWTTGEDVQLCHAVRELTTGSCYVLPANYSQPDTMGVSHDYISLSDAGDTTQRLGARAHERTDQEHFLFSLGEHRRSWSRHYRHANQTRVMVVSQDDDMHEQSAHRLRQHLQGFDVVSVIVHSERLATHNATNLDGGNHTFVLHPGRDFDDTARHAVLGQVLVGLRGAVEATQPHLLIVNVDDTDLYYTVLLSSHGASACVARLDSRGLRPANLVKPRTRRQGDDTGGERRRRRAEDDNCVRCARLSGRHS